MYVSTIAGGNGTITLNKNGVATSLAVNPISNNVVSDTSHSVSFNAGDYANLTFQYNNIGTYCISFEFDPA